jgi:hypothetical protein
VSRVCCDCGAGRPVMLQLRPSKLGRDRSPWFVCVPCAIATGAIASSRARMATADAGAVVTDEASKQTEIQRQGEG